MTTSSLRSFRERLYVCTQSNEVGYSRAKAGGGNFQVECKEGA